MKSKFYILAALGLAVSLQAAAFSVENSEGQSLSYSISSSRANAVLLEGGASDIAGELVIPATVEYDNVTYDVVGVDSYAFQGSHDITAISFPESVESIGNSAFLECGITSLVIPDNVTSLSPSAFASNASLTSVEVGEGLTELPTSAFAFCTALTRVELGSNITSLAEAVFYGDTELNSIVSKAVNPPAVSDGTFMAVPKTCLVEVPQGSEELYKAADGWKDFAYNPTTTGAVLISADALTPADAAALNGADAAALITVYDLSGRPIATLPATALSTLPASGLLILRTSTGATKLLK